MSAPASSVSVRLSVALLASAALVAAGERKFTVTNKCSYTIWPAIFTGGGSTHPGIENGWEAAPGSSREFTVPDTWTAGRIWARTDCNFDGSGQGSCLTGNCFGGLVCDQTQGYGMAPASLAEFTFGQGTPGVDWYDVSIVDGTNVPMAIQLSNSCAEASCPVDLNPECPTELQGPLDSNGKVSSCKTACIANLDGNPADSANCCTGSHSDRPACPASGVQFYDYFKKKCPNSYAYAFDEDSGTAMYGCDTNTEGVPDYSLVFCPAGDDGNGAPAPAPAPEPAPAPTPEPAPAPAPEPSPAPETSAAPEEPTPEPTTADAPVPTPEPTTIDSPAHAPGPARPPPESSDPVPTLNPNPIPVPAPSSEPIPVPSTTEAAPVPSTTEAAPVPAPTETEPAPEPSATVSLPAEPAPTGPATCAKRKVKRDLRL